MFQGVKLVIYDLDGVLIDSNKAILESFRRTMEEVGAQFKPDMIMDRIGVSLYQIFLDTMPDEYHSRLEELRHLYIKHFQSLDITYITLLPDVVETLAELKRRGLMQALATNKTVTEAERILLELGINQFFNLMAGFTTVDKPKPEPDMILYTLGKLGVASEEAVLVDDTNVGLMAGIRAGIKTIGITTGNNTIEQIEEVEPTVIIHRLSELPKILE